MFLGLILLIIILFSLLFSGLYVGFSLAGVAIFGFEFIAHAANWVGATLYNSVNSFILTAIPFFLFMGQLVLYSGLSGRLYRGVSKWVRIIPGGLVHSNIVSCSIFAAISGSSPATAATIGTIAYPEQRKKKYNSSLVAGSLAAGGTLGILIPPSINMIVYGAFVGQSVGQLFIAGIVPGIIIAVIFMIVIVSLVKKQPSLAPIPEKVKLFNYLYEGLKALNDIWPFFAIIFLIMGSIYSGVMTPTEAAAASAFLAIIFGFLFGKLNIKLIIKAALSSLKISGMFLLLYVGANLLGNVLSVLRIPANICNIVARYNLESIEVWIAVIFLYLILGCFMDTLAMMLVTLPVTYPLMVEICGFDPIWFGIELVLLCEIGMITPPVGINLYVLQGIAPDIGQKEIIHGVVPFFLVLLFFVFFFTFFPNIILFLPRLLFS